MRASLIIAAHNEGDALWHTVGSCVETEGGLDCEIIIADDFSSDGSIEETVRRFPRVRLVRHDARPGAVPFGPDALVSGRRGASPTKDLGARHARGDVLVFLDGHCKPENGALVRLIEDVEHVSGAAVITPKVVALDVPTWEITASQVGHGYFVELEQFHCGWLPLSELRGVDHGGRRFYESPALIGCALAVDRRLYDRVQGFDPYMRTWGVEDLDFGLKCWLLGFPILHDPAATVGHRFRSTFDNYSVPFAHLIVNQLRMARKNFTDGTWSDWVERCRVQHGGKLLDHPEGLWAQVWQQFEADRASVEAERAYLMAHRIRDEFWYADRFALSWPRLHSAPFPSTAAALEEPQPSPSPSPAPCNITGVTPATATVCADEAVAFSAVGTGLGDASWSTSPAGDPATGTGATFSTKWAAPGEKTVTVSCGDSSAVATVTVVKVTFDADPVKTGFNKRAGDPIIKVEVKATVEPASAAESIVIEAGGANPGRISIENIQVHINREITFDVKGVSMTPVNRPKGDTRIVAKLNGNVCAHVQAIVLIPLTVVPYSVNGPVTGVNQAADKTTSPVYGATLAAGSVNLWTYYAQWMTIAVTDQFGDLLAPFYEGATVSEHAGISINQEINGFGTYQDPVFSQTDRPGQSIFPATDPIAIAWPSAAILPITLRNVVQTIPVQVGGHELKPGIAKRRLIATAPNNVQIIWPSP